MKEDSAIYAFVIIVLKWPPEAVILAGKNGTHFFFTKSWSKNNFKPKNQFQQANPTGAQNLTLWPLLLPYLPFLNLFSFGTDIFYHTRNIHCTYKLMSPKVIVNLQSNLKESIYLFCFENNYQN